MKNFSSSELRRLFLEFFEQRGHKRVPSSSLIPADPTSLFTSAGMQQFVPYLSGTSEPPYRRACSVQKCLRVDDIEEVGDATHHTFFEMLGNWSFGDYFKEEAIDWALELLVHQCGFDQERLWVSIFKGKDNIARDSEAEKIWMKKGFPRERIFEYGVEDNFWGPVSAIGPCGHSSEIFYKKSGEPCGPDCHPNCECGHFVEIWNLVFMEYNKTKEGKFVKLAQQNIDTGLGFERVVALLQNKDTPYETDLFQPLIDKIQEFSGRSYKNNVRDFRVIADHLRAVCFTVSEGILPSNTGRGYVLRMLLRRMFRHAYQLEMGSDFYPALIDEVIEIYGGQYPELEKRREEIKEVIRKEENRFGQTLDKGLSQFQKLIKEKTEKNSSVISGEEAFDLYQSYGFPLELTRDLARERGFRVDEEGFHKAFEEHRQASRKGADKKFGGVGIEDLGGREEVRQATRLHTATHLLQSALREVLGEHVEQMGSDITPERLRFDFSHPEAVTKEELDKVEKWVNDKIEGGLTVSREEMPYEKAVDSGALAFFKAKYPRKVFVYAVGPDPVSKEICAGPHVENTKELGRFEITKEESVGAGMRRIKAVLKDS